MSMKSIAVAARMLAMVATLTAAAQAAPTTAGGQAAGLRQGTAPTLALLILRPQQSAVG